MLINENSYPEMVARIKNDIRQAQYRTALHANSELILLYYRIGHAINIHKEWGNKFIDNLAHDIKLEFPDSTGYSVRNLKYMAKLAATYPDEQFVQQAVAQIPWGHNVVLLDKVSDDAARAWYITATAANGWSRNVLVHQIESDLYGRQVLAGKVNNYDNRLPSPQSELAIQTMKDPYLNAPGYCETDLKKVGFSQPGISETVYCGEKDGGVFAKGDKLTVQVEPYHLWAIEY